jgi:hypothetical protein
LKSTSTKTIWAGLPTKESKTDNEASQKINVNSNISKLTNTTDNFVAGKTQNYYLN